MHLAGVAATRKGAGDAELTALAETSAAFAAEVSKRAGARARQATARA